MSSTEEPQRASAGYKESMEGDDKDPLKGSSVNKEPGAKETSVKSGAGGTVPGAKESRTKDPSTGKSAYDEALEKDSDS